jgi:hypothetical protein
MRARSLKPGFFKNEELAELSFETRILFEGLWCFSDREGRFEWRPKKIKVEIFPYDNLNIEKLLTALLDKKFIDKYQVNGQVYGSIPTFLHHQNPHIHEAKSVIPEKLEENQCPDIYGTSTVQAPDNEQPKPEVARLTPDSGLLTPDSGLLTPSLPKHQTPPDIVLLFNETTQYLPKVTRTKSRDEKIRIRLREHKEVDWWKVVFEKADLVLIPPKKPGDRDWFPTFDWLIDNDKNSVKVFEGNYDDAKRPVKIEKDYPRAEDVLKRQGMGPENFKWKNKEQERLD